MSKLLEKLRKEAARVKAESEKKSDFTKIDMFKPKDGENIIRILPHWKDKEELFFKRIMLHYINFTKRDGGVIENVPVRCLRDFDEACPVCDEYERRVKKVDKEDKKEWEKVRRLRPTERYLYNIIDYKEKKLLPFAAPSTVHGQIMEYAEDFGEDMVSLTKGRDWKVVKKIDPRKPKNLGTTYHARPAIKESILPDKLNTLLEGIYNLDDIYSENRKADMLKFLGIEESSDEAEVEAAEELDTGDAVAFADDEAETKVIKAKESVKKAKVAVKEEPEEEEEDEEEDDGFEKDDDDEAEEVLETKPKAKAPKGIAAKSKKAEVEVEDDDLDAELKELGVL